MTLTEKSNAEEFFSDQLIGQRLSGIVFVLDYLQFQFDPPPILSVYTPVSVQFEGACFRSGDDQFRNKICTQITKVVLKIQIKASEALVITFTDGSAIFVSLKPSDCAGRDIIDFRGRKNEIYSI